MVSIKKGYMPKDFTLTPSVVHNILREEIKSYFKKHIEEMTTDIVEECANNVLSKIDSTAVDRGIGFDDPINISIILRETIVQPRVIVREKAKVRDRL